MDKKNLNEPGICTRFLTPAVVGAGSELALQICQSAFDAAVPILSQLLKAETAEREARSIAYQIKDARFPACKNLAGFDFASSEANEALVASCTAATSWTVPTTSS